MVPRVVLAAVLLCLAPLAAPALAQTTGTIGGSVLDASSGVVPGVTVSATNESTGLVRTATTGPAGRFVIPALPPGPYTLEATLAGFKPLIRRGIDVTIA